ncbi:TetR/AcrR family transcriptional regulator [Streptomyces sp. NPDC048254]|uniref:TetR/AcrR family transcriptional regulator n=1 Tax=Streptomyces sp. NPDC048254 TaxID=3365525 RepID=UPI00371103FD
MSAQAAGKGRARSPRGQGEQLRREILRAVGRLLDEWGGVEKLTMRAVAREVGVAAPSIYLHFSDKAELVWAALEDKYEDLAARMRAADTHATDSGADARGGLRAQAHAYCRFASEYPGHYRLMYEVRQPSVPTARLHRHPSRHVSLSLREAFARCREAGYPLAMPDEQAAQTLWAGLHGFIALQHALSLSSSAQAQEPLEPLADGLVDALIPAEPSHGAQPPAADTEAARRIRAILAGQGDSASPEAS